MATLPTNFQDDVLDVTQNENRKYNVIQNQDGTVSLEDVTVYVQQGSQYGAQNVNAQNTEINALNSNLTTNDGTNDVPFKFVYDSASGKYGYKDGADTFCPFSSVGDFESLVPPMSSNVQGKYRASASDGSANAYRVFDGNESTGYMSPDTNSYWLQIDLGDVHFIAYLKMVYKAYGAGLHQFNVLTSEDGSTWVNLNANNYYPVIYPTADSQVVRPTIPICQKARYVRFQTLVNWYTYGSDTYTIKTIEVWGS